MDDEDGKHETIESLVIAFDKAKPFNKIFLNYCICGKEYMNKNNYLNYDLFLPKYTKAGTPFGPILKDPAKSKVLVFDADVHIKKKKTSEVTEFGDGPGDDPDAGGPGTGPAEFEL